MTDEMRKKIIGSEVLFYTEKEEPYIIGTVIDVDDKTIMVARFGATEVYVNWRSIVLR